MTTILTALGCFFLGVFFAPAVKPLLRPFFLEIVKVIVSLLTEIKFASAKMKEEMDDAVAAANGTPASGVQTQPVANPASG